MNRTTAIDCAWTVLRIVAAFLFIQVGGLKLFGWFGGMPGGQHAATFSKFWVAGGLEVCGGTLILIGLATRPVAFLLSGEMAVAYWTAHFPHGTWPIQNHGEQAVLFCFLYLFMSAYGAGPYSVDALISLRRPAARSEAIRYRTDRGRETGTPGRA